MFKFWTIATIAAVVVGIALLPSLLRKGARSNDITIYLHNRGNTVILDPKSQGFKDLLILCEESLTSSDVGRMLRLAVFPATIQQIKSKEISIEIVYPEPKDFHTGQSKETTKTVKLDRLLIPLSGQFAETATKEKYVTVFYGVHAYDSGPYTNSEDFHNKITRSLEKIGYSIK